MQHRMTCKIENKIDYIKDICSGIENGGEITMVKYWTTKRSKNNN